METSRIQQLLHDRFTDVTNVGANLFKASRSIRTRLAGIYFFDCSEAVLKPDFDIQAYQDRMLSNEYYSSSGSLQWNLYLYFICDPEGYEELVRSGRLATIEENRTYARKYVTTEERLEKDLVKAVESSDGDQPVDITLRWMEKLREQKLDGVFMKSEPYTQVVDRYMQNDPIIETEGREKKSKVNGRMKLSSIVRLSIAEWNRPSPKQKDFDFGLFNLIEGANGSGKTSLLEAIELWTCGKTFHNPRHDYQARIGITFDDGEGVEWNIQQENELFRRRDLKWYGNHYVKGNNLCLGFNRFNFYNTDAAVTMESPGDEEKKSVRSALSDLVLGESAVVLEERAAKILELFRKEQSLCASDIEFYLQSIREAEQELKSLGLTKESLADLLSNFSSHLKRLGWQGHVPTDLEASLETFAEEFTKVYASIRECRSKINWMPSLTLSELVAEETKLSELLTEVETANTRINDYMVESWRVGPPIEEISKELELMRKLTPYVHTPDSSRLLGLRQGIEQQTKAKQLYAEVQTKVQDISLDEYSTIDQTLPVFEDHLQGQLNSISEKVASLEEMVKSLEETLGHIAKLNAEIRAAASELLNHAPHTTNCPICDAHYGSEELRSLILRARRADETRQDKILRHRIEELTQYRKDSGALAKRLAEVRDITSALSMLTDQTSVPVRDAIQTLAGIPASVSGVIKRLEDLQVLMVRIRFQGLHEGDYEALIARAKRIDEDFPVEHSNRERFDRLFEAKQATLSDLSARERRIRASISTEIESKESALREYLKTFLPDDLESELRLRNDIVKRLLKNYEEDCRKFVDGYSLPIGNLISLLGELEAAYDNFMQSRKYLEESVLIRQREEAKLIKTRTELDSAVKRKSRADLAISTIEDILENDSKEKHLSAFLRENTCEIAETFRLIHAPREFSSIKFDEADEAEIVLVREADNSRVPVSRISSGQRSALALSIFLTLNRKLANGPPFLMFDDPTAYVDDLNILSFFDYLRDTSLTLDRQVFFATASDKIAYLFKKKFDFLGDDCRHHRLSWS